MANRKTWILFEIIPAIILILLGSIGISIDRSMALVAMTDHNPHVDELLLRILQFLPLMLVLSATLAALHYKSEPIRYSRSLFRISLAIAPFLLLAVRLLEKRYLLVNPTEFLRISSILLFLIILHALFEKSVFKYWRLYQSWHATGFSLLLLIVSALWAGGIPTPRSSPTGDEPSYLMITHSIAEDGDVVMDDDYAAKVYLRFYPGKYQMFTHLGFDGLSYPHHSIGLPFLLAPLYRAVVRIQSDTVFLFFMRMAMGLIFALLGLQTHRLIADWSGSMAITNWTCTALFFSGPLLFYSIEIYPETMVALIAVSVMRRMLMLNQSFQIGEILLIGASIAYLPWLGIKYFAIALGLIIAILLLWSNHPGRLRMISFLILPIVISGCLYAGFLFDHYRNFNPSVVYSGVIPGTGQMPVSLAVTKEYSLLDRAQDILFFSWGLLIEQRIGILFLAPISLFALPGLAHCLSFRRKETLAVLSPILAHLAIYAWHNNWGGYCPPNRQIIAVTPLIGLFVAIGLRECRTWIAAIYAYGSTLIGWMVSLLCLYHPDWMYHTMNPHLVGGEAKLLRAFSLPYSVDITGFFPLIMGQARNMIANVFWSVGFLLLTALLFLRQPAPIHPKRIRNGYIALIVIGGLVWQLWGFPLNRHDFKTPPEPFSHLSFLDRNVFGYEAGGFWLRAGQTTEIIASVRDVSRLIRLRGYSLVQNTLRLKIGGRESDITTLEPNTPFQEALTPKRTIKRGADWYFKIVIGCETGARPSILLGTNDIRNLGVFFSFYSDEVQHESSDRAD